MEWLKASDVYVPDTTRAAKQENAVKHEVINLNAKKQKKKKKNKRDGGR